MDEQGVRTSENVLFEERQRGGYIFALATLSTFFVIAGFAYSRGRMESATMLLLLGIGLSIYVLVLATLVVRFFVPIKVMMSDDGVVLHYSGRRIRNIAWSEIRTLRYEAPIKSISGKKKGDVMSKTLIPTGLLCI